MSQRGFCLNPVRSRLAMLVARTNVRRYRTSARFERVDTGQQLQLHAEQETNPLWARVSALSRALVRAVGLEPTRCCHRGILSPLRLPVPPRPRVDLHSFFVPGRQMFSNRTLAFSISVKPVHALSGRAFAISQLRLAEGFRTRGRYSGFNSLLPGMPTQRF
jgi:hypothetical protein